VEVIQSDITNEEVSALFDLWNNALAIGNLPIVTAQYAKDAALLPTVSNKPHTNYNGIIEYFDLFLKCKPRGKIIQSHIKVGNGWA